MFDPFKKIAEYMRRERDKSFFRKLVDNNTGTSSKNFFLITVTIIGCLLLIIPAVVMLVEIIFNHTIATDLNGMAAYIGAVAGLFATAGLTKVWGDKFEGRKNEKNEEKKENQ